MKKLSETQAVSILKKIKLTSERYLVMLSVDEDESISIDDQKRNIYCIDSKNNIIWQIDIGIDAFETDTYVSMRRTNGKVIVHKFFGNEYEVDLLTGQVKNIGFHK